MEIEGYANKRQRRIPYEPGATPQGKDTKYRQGLKARFINSRMPQPGLDRAVGAYAAFPSTSGVARGWYESGHWP
jgi:hypothetical protein